MAHATPYAISAAARNTTVARVIPFGMPMSSRYRLMKKLAIKKTMVDTTILTMSGVRYRPSVYDWVGYLDDKPNVNC